MKALNLYDKQDIRLEEVPRPVIENKDDVIIKVKAAGICGSDISRYNKLGPYVEGTTFGHEFSGEVVKIGSDVTTIKVGDRVAGCPTFYCGKCDSCKKGELARCENLHVMGAYHPGAFAEFTKLPEENVIPVPDNVVLILQQWWNLLHWWRMVSTAPIFSLVQKWLSWDAETSDCWQFNGRRFSVPNAYMRLI